MAHRDPEGLQRLPGKGASAGIDDGYREHHRQGTAALLEILVDGKQRRLAVEGVEDGFYQKEIAAPLHQSAHLVIVGVAQLVETHIAPGRLIDIRRKRGGTVGRPQGAGDKAGLPRGFIIIFVASLAGEAGRGQVHLVDQVGHVIIEHRNAVGAESVGFDDIRSGLQVGKMDLPDHLRPGEGEEVVVAFQITGMIGKAITAKIFLA